MKGESGGAVAVGGGDMGGRGRRFQQNHTLRVGQTLSVTE